MFDYKGRDLHGKLVSGVIEAANEEMAQDLLTERGYIITRLTERKIFLLGKYLGLDVFNKVKHKDMVIFSRQLAVMISATVPIVKALRILIKQTESVKLKSVVSEIADDVESGAKLSSAMGKFSEVFSPFFVSMIKSGETSGRLSEVLNYLADQQEKDFDLIKRVKGKMIYPAFILFFLVLVFIFMMVYVVPQITGLVRESGAELPFTTKMLIAVSDFFVNYWLWMVLGVISVFGGLRFFIKTEKGKVFFDYFMIRVPIVGPFFVKLNLVRFTRGLSTLMVGKVPVTVALEVVADIVDNRVFRGLILETVKLVEDGNSISSAFEESPYVPVMVSNMLAVGEQTGKLEDVLGRLTDFYSR